MLSYREDCMRKTLTKSQKKAAATIVPCYGMGLRCTRVLDAYGSYWVEVEVKPTTDLERELVARYGWIARTYLINRRGEVLRPNTWTPDIENAVFAYSSLATFIPGA
jgi:hypothetical protein